MIRFTSDLNSEIRVGPLKDGFIIIRNKFFFKHLEYRTYNKVHDDRAD